MFGFKTRSARLKEIIEQETKKLSKDAKRDLDVLYPVVVSKGNQGGFIPISDDQYDVLNDAQKSADEHKKRRDYILSRHIEHLLINRPPSEKIKDWLLKNKDTISLLGIGPMIQYYIQNKDAVDHFAHSFTPYLSHIIQLVNDHSPEEFTADKDSRDAVEQLITAARDSFPSDAPKPEHVISISFVQNEDVDVLRYLTALPENERKYLFNLSEDEEFEDGVIEKSSEEVCLVYLELLRQTELNQNNQTGR